MPARNEARCLPLIRSFVKRQSGPWLAGNRAQIAADPTADFEPRVTLPAEATREAREIIEAAQREATAIRERAEKDATAARERAYDEARTIRERARRSLETLTEEIATGRR